MDDPPVHAREDSPAVPELPGVAALLHVHRRQMLRALHPEFQKC
jgi:hypothetical protein